MPLYSSPGDRRWGRAGPNERGRGTALDHRVAGSVGCRYGFVYAPSVKSDAVALFARRPALVTDWSYHKQEER